MFVPFTDAGLYSQFYWFEAKCVMEEVVCFLNSHLFIFCAHRPGIKRTFPFVCKNSKMLLCGARGGLNNLLQSG